MTDSLPDGYQIDDGSGPSSGVGNVSQSSQVATSRPLTRPPHVTGLPDGYAIDDTASTPKTSATSPTAPPTSLAGNLARSARGAATTGLGETLGGLKDFGDAIAARADATPASVERGANALDAAHVPLPLPLAIGANLIRPSTMAPVNNYADVLRFRETAPAALESRGSDIQASTSPEFQEATSKPILERPSFTNVANKAINTVAGMAAPLAASFTPGIGPIIAPVTFGAQGERQGREEGAQEVAALTDNQLAAVPRYQELLQSGLAPDKARAQLSDEVADRKAVVSGTFGAALGVVGKIPGASTLESAVAPALTRAFGQRAGSALAAGAAEGAGFSGINAAGQVASNVSDQVPTPAGKGVVEAAASGLLPGAAMGLGRHAFVKPYPDARPGTLSDAANAIHEATAPATQAAFVPEAANTTAPTEHAGPKEPRAAFQAETSPTPPSVPWIDATTGERRDPTFGELKDQFHRAFEQASQEGLGPGIVNANQRLAKEWSVDRQLLQRARNQAWAERKAGFRFGQPAPVQGELSPEEPTTSQSTITHDDQNVTARSTSQEQPTVTSSDTVVEATPARGVPAADETAASAAEPDKALSSRLSRVGAQQDGAEHDQSPAAEQREPADVTQTQMEPLPDALPDASRVRARESADNTQVSSASPAAPERSASATYSDFLGKAFKRRLMEEHGQAILDDMQERGESPQDVANKFWTSTYWNLPGAVQRRFAAEYTAHTGTEPDLGNPRELLDNIDVGSKAEHLEGGERGFVALMREANRRLDAARAGDAEPSAGYVEKPRIDSVAGPNASSQKNAVIGNAADVSQVGKPSVYEAAKESAAHPENDLPEPTPAQHEANNFKQGHVNLHGLDISIQVPKGGMRRGTDANGQPWEREASDHYGHIRRTEGADGEQVDVYLGPHAHDPNAKVFVIDQNRPGTNRFDESKAMIGYKTGRDARASYDANFPKGLKVFGAIREMSIDQFKSWVKEGDTTKPAGSARLAPESRGVSVPSQDAGASAEARTEGKPPPVANQRAAEITDVGEKIGGARKDMWRSHNMRREELANLNERELAEFVKKDAVFKRPDYTDLVKNLGRETAYGVKLVYDGIPNPGDKLTRAQYEDYVTAVGKVRDALAGVKTNADLQNLMEKAFGADIITGSGYYRRFNRESPNFQYVRLLGNKMARTLQQAGFNDSTITRKLAKSAWPEKSEAKAAVNGKLKPEPREKLVNVRRTGNDFRGGKDVGAEHFKNTFGFRGVEFGNWTDQGDRQASLNHAFDGLHDLADALGIPPKAVSLNGQLGLAFGARGKGSAAAHYEPTRAVINLTKTSGAGSVAHEWAHAVDDYFGKLSGDPKLKGRDWAVTDALVKRYGIEQGVGDLRPELVKAISNVMRAINERARTPDEAAKSANDALDKINKALPRLGETLKDGMGPKFDEKTKQLFDAAVAGSGDVGEQVSELARHVEVTAGKKSIANETVERIRRQLLSRDSFTKALRQAIDKPGSEFGKVGTDYLAKSRALGPYWARPHELFARAFESFVHDKIVGEGNRSDYLTHPGNRDRGVTNPRFPYPAAGERATINGAFEQFVGALRHKDTEGGNVALFRPGASGIGTESERAARFTVVSSAIDKAKSGWGDQAPDLRAVPHPDQAPADVVAKMAAERPQTYRDAKGFYDGDRLYVFTDNAKNVPDALRTAMHEVVGHFGVDRVMEQRVKGGWDRLVADTERLRANPDKAAPSIRDALQSVERRYRNEDGSPADPHTFASELLATMAERGLRNNLMDRLIAAIRAFVRKAFPSLRFNESDLRGLLRASEDYIKSSRTEPRLAPVRQTAFERAEPTDTPAFARWFGNSKVIDAKGAPQEVWHGTADDFNEFEDQHSGTSTGHMTAPLGHYFDESRQQAQRYAEKASNNVPADQRLISAYLSIEKPYAMKLTDFMKIDSQDEARALRAKLQREGYDGIKLDLGNRNQWIAFDSRNVKSTSNVGTWDHTNPDIRFALGDNEDFRKPRASVDRLAEVLAKPDQTTYDRAKAWVRGKAEDFRPAALGALQTRHVLELMETHPALKGAKEYGEGMQRLATDRNQLMSGAPDAAEHPESMLHRGGAVLADALRDYTYEKGPAGWFGRKRPQAKQLADAMHDATVYGLDPSEPYKRLQIEDARGDSEDWTSKGIRDRIDALRGQMRGRPGDDKSLLMDEVKRLRNLPRQEKLREQRWPDLVKRYNALPAEGKALYRQVRDWYAQMRDETEKALIARIEAMGDQLGKKYVRTMQDRIRLQFEGFRRDGVYFPLDRNGDYWTSFVDSDGRQGFKMFESAREAAQGERKLRAAGFKIEAQGRRDGTYRAKDAPSGTFVAGIIKIARQSGAPEKVLDEIYQTFLKTLPEMSMRKHSIHRQNVPGFDDDALRAFAKNAFHGAHQLARLRHAHGLQHTIESMQEAMDNYRRSSDLESSTTSTLDVARGDALLNELKKRHELILSPKDAQLANYANAIGFAYHLGLSPASAITNLTRNAQVTLPVLGAHHGWDKATRVLGAAVRDALRTFGNIDRTLTSPEEKRAYAVLRARGDIDKTQTHSLAGLAEGNRLQTNPMWSASMRAIGYMFHKAEVINRESAGIAAFRLEYAQSRDFQKAVTYASDIINGTHFDYSAANRSRYMHGNVPRIALQFKNYSLGMTWIMYRNLYQALKGETPEVRRVARRTLTGILGMTALMAGSVGLPTMNAMRAVGNASHALFGDDEPFDFDTEYRTWLAENLGEEPAKYIADGAANQIAGANLASRVSLSNLWFQEADRELEGKDEYYAMLESLAGPLGGVAKNILVGQKEIADGNTERGWETILPKFAKDALKAMRYESDGATTLRGDPLVPDITGPEALVQGLGFTPTRLFEQQRTNSALENYQHEILERRTRLINAYVMAIQASQGTQAAISKISAFNEQYPEIAIKSQSIRQTMRSRARYTAEAEGGIRLDKKLTPRLREMVNEPVSAAQ